MIHDNAHDCNNSQSVADALPVRWADNSDLIISGFSSNDASVQFYPVSVDDKVALVYVSSHFLQGNWLIHPRYNKGHYH